MRLKLAGLFAAIVFAAATSSLGDEAAPIRPFDLATVESLGQAMYVQDQLAWKATDLALKEHGASWLTEQSSHGWIVDTLPDRNVIRFVREDSGTPQVFYDVTFAGNAAPQSSIPASTGLSAEELGQYRARRLALANVKESCSTGYNSIALKDPEREGWLVWALAASQDPNLILIGGHYRFSISADGTAIRAADRLSRSCLRFDRRQQPKGTSGMLMSHVVSSTPVETHVFASLSYKQAFFVGTPGGAAWRVDGATITSIDMDSPAEAGFAARVFAGQDEQCRAIVTRPAETPPKFYIASGVQVIDTTENADKFTLTLPDGVALVSVVCSRDDLVPAPNDYKVLAGGYGLTLIHGDDMLDYTFKDGVVSYRVVKGSQPSGALAQRIAARLEGFRKLLTR